ncbi:MAG: NPCBM/NEW2 domain-containing protein [Armatimonadota bacterium]
MMILGRIICLTAVAVTVISAPAEAIKPTPIEMDQARRWAAAKFEGIQIAPRDEAYLDVKANNERVWQNSRLGKPMKIVDKQYNRGLYCHAVSEVVVHLPAPAKKFLAVVGVDSNDQTVNADRSTVVFSVEAEGKSLFHTDVIREGTPGIPISVDLGGVNEFTIKVGDAGDGITCDQADWADARVEMANGETIWLGDLPILSARPSIDTVPPFSFIYDGITSSDFLSGWNRNAESKKIDAKRTKTVLTFDDPKTGLQLKCESVEYSDYPAVEWIIYFKNNGSKDTPVISNIRAMDLNLIGSAQSDFMVHHAKGSDSVMSDFAPTEEAIKADKPLNIGSQMYGCSSIEALPFFNAWAGDQGVITGIGWSGAWTANFTNQDNKQLRIDVGMKDVNLILHPGEQLRMPRMLMMFWSGDRARSYNLWRRLMLAYYSPEPDGKPLVGPLTDGNWGAVSAKDQIVKMDWWVKNKLPLECYWIDAGWSGKTGPMDSWPVNAATRVPNPEYYPNGMKEVADAAHARGMDFLLWMIPQMALPDVEIGKEHPEWLVNGSGLDHGNPDTNAWIKKYFSKFLADNDIDVYRQDGTPVYPADKDANRKGMNEIRNLEGFYEYWDYLLEHKPDLVIDNCCGGGRKIDLETSKRSISLWRSDYQVPNDFDPIGMQGQTYGLSYFVPLSGGAAAKTDPYSMRSGYGPALCINWHVYPPVIDSKGFDFKTARRMLDEYLDVRRYFNGDYYPLTKYDINQDTWMAWQFDLPETGEGMVQAFRRTQSIFESGRLKLHGLDSDTRYSVRDTDKKASKSYTGAELMEEGLLVTLKGAPSASVILYKKL